MTGLEQVAILAAGLIAGIVTSTVGVASLVSFPVLLAIGIPPVVANASNTVGLIPAGLSGSLGYRRELREQPHVTWYVVATCAIGSIGGAALLLCLPAGVFEPRTAMSPVTTFVAALTGVYGGYFGAGAGVMMMAVLGLGLDLELRVVNALKTLAVLAANVIAGLIFVFVADLNLTAVGLLAAGSVVGGYTGAHIGRRLPPNQLRILIVVAGMTGPIVMVRAH